MKILPSHFLKKTSFIIFRKYSDVVFAPFPTLALVLTMQLGTEVLNVITQTPDENLVRLVDLGVRKTKEQQKLLSELLRHLLMSFVKTIKTDELKKNRKHLLENGLEIGFKHKNDLPDHIWGAVFKFLDFVGW